MANRRTTVGLDSYILTTDASKGASLFATATSRNFVGDKTAQTAHIVDTDTDLQWELSTAGTYVYDARTNDVWKYGTTWAKDTSGTFKLAIGRQYTNPLTRKMFFVETLTRVRTVTLGLKELAAPPPLPDFWAPLSSSLALNTGLAPYDQASATDLRSRSLQFTRASTATYVDKSGVVRTAAINEPRFEAPGLLFEGASTNLVLASSNLDDAYWVKVRGSTTTGFTAPDLGSSAVKFVPNTENLTHYIKKDYTTVAGKYTWSVYVKAGEITSCIINVSTASTSSSPVLNLLTGVMTGTTSGVSVQSLVNGWFRISVAFDGAVGTTTLNIIAVGGTPASTAFTGDGTSGFYVWGAQLEALPVPSSYIPTTTAAATRARDVGSVALSNWGATMFEPFTVAMELNRPWNVLPLDAPRVMRIVTGGAATELSMGWGNVIGLRAAVGTSNITAPLPLGQNTVGMRYTGGYTSVFVGPTIMTSGTKTTALNTPQQIAIGDSTVGGTESARPIFAHIKNFRIWNRALTDEQIKGL